MLSTLPDLHSVPVTSWLEAEANDNFDWAELKGKTVIGGRAGGMPQMLFEYILKKNNIDPETDLEILPEC